MVAPVSLTHLPYTTDAGIASRARIGLVVLASDLTIEHEWRRVLADIDGVALHHARLFNDARITPETLRAMEGLIAPTAALLLPGHAFDVVAYGCTSASMVLGEERVIELLREAKPEAKATTPITAARIAMQALGAKRIALLTPYRDDLNEALRTYLEARGIEVPVMGSFNEEDDGIVGRIDPASLAGAAARLGAYPEVDAVFVSCTSLRLAEAAAAIEARIGKPVTSSNHAMLWHALRLAGIDDRLPRWGRLFEASTQ
jgi:maleate isomerase